MSSFLVGHAAHADWREALARAASQIDGARSRLDTSGAAPLSLGFVYFSDHYVAQADALLAALRERWPGVAWAGASGVGVAANATEHFDQPALALMLAPLAAGRFEVFSGARKLRRVDAHTALVHADSATPDMAELIGEMSDRTASGYLFGGLASSRTHAVHIADGVWRGGLSGVAFTRDVPLISRVTQGSQPVGPVRRVTASDRHIVLELDHRPALGCLLEDLGLRDLGNVREAVPRLRGTLVGLSDAHAEPEAPFSTSPAAAAAPAVVAALSGQFGVDTRVRHLLGLDPTRQAVAVSDLVEPGMRLAFCQRDVQAARRDLVRICSEIRDEIESHAEREHPAASGTAPRGGRSGGPEAAADAASRIRGAIYVSCAGRGGPHFGGPSAELQIVRRALGEVPLVGFFAGGEIAHHHLYGYTGVLTVFTRG